MDDIFEVAGGSVPGLLHRNAYRNSHDAYHLVENSEATVAVVCDGCGSGAHSEVGAKIAARFLAERISAGCLRGECIEHVLAAVETSLLSYIRILSEAMTPDPRNMINDYFLFTILGFVVTRSRTITFAAGDGFLFVNGEMRKLEAPDNQPEYLSAGGKIHLISLHDTHRVDSLLLATDGLEDLLRSETPVSHFWEDDRYFRNPFSLQRKLHLLNRPAMRVDYDARRVNRKPGRLPDDTTIVVARRRTG